MRKTVLYILSLTLLLTGLAGCGGGSTGGWELIPPSAAPSPSPGTALKADPTPTPPEPTPTGEPEPTPTGEPEPTPTPEPDEPYLFGTPVGESEEVEGSEWFSDALFVGDSRTEGMQVYSGIKNADFLWHRGMSVFKATREDYRVFEQESGEMLNLSEALALKQYAKVYLMIGTNELGYTATAYEKGLGSLLEMLHTAQPDAVIYLQTLPPVNEEMALAKGLGVYINNENVNAFNEAIVRQAREQRVALLDVASLFRDETGKLPAELASDGVHFRKAGYQMWAAYLRTHTLDREDYLSGQPAEELWSPLPDLPEVEESVPPEGETESVPPETEESALPEESPELSAGGAA